MNILNIDIETYSEEPIENGVHKYAEHPSFEILLFGYSFNGAPVRVVDFTAGEKLPVEVTAALLSPKWVKRAYNAAFEIACISAYFCHDLDPEQWECTQVYAAIKGYPMGLALTSKAMGLRGKIDEGKDLIKLFCVPVKPTKRNHFRTRELPQFHFEKWETFKRYCAQDVIAEMQVRAFADRVFYDKDALEREWRIWRLDQKINNRGVRIETKLANNAVRIDTIVSDKLETKARELTGIENPNSPAQIKKWLIDQAPAKIRDEAIAKLGQQKPGKNTADFVKVKDGLYYSLKEVLQEIWGIEGIGKEEVSTLLLSDSVPGHMSEFLLLRQEMAKSSIKKYYSMLEGLCRDGRARGLFQYYGATRTGRWAGRRVQLQNLPKNHMALLDLARQLVFALDLPGIEAIFGNVPDVLSQLLRTALIPEDGKKLVVSDFSAIEARVLAWLAGEKWRLDVFNTHGKIYEASAAQMFRVPIDSISYKGEGGETVKGPNFDLRQKGKVSELALGYEGWVGSLISMGALKMGLSEPELPGMIKAWRLANPAICGYWKKLNFGAIDAIRNPGKVIDLTRGMNMRMRDGDLHVTLPSGRSLIYVQARLTENRWGNTAVGFMSMSDKKQWVLEETYGGKLTENLTQAVARDCLTEGMLRADRANYEIVSHVHDEIVAEEDAAGRTHVDLDELLACPISWAPGLPLAAAGFDTLFYKKED